MRKSCGGTGPDPFGGLEEGFGGGPVAAGILAAHRDLKAMLGRIVLGAPGVRQRQDRNPPRAGPCSAIARTEPRRTGPNLGVRLAAAHGADPGCRLPAELTVLPLVGEALGGPRSAAQVLWRTAKVSRARRHSCRFGDRSGPRRGRVFAGQGSRSVGRCVPSRASGDRRRAKPSAPCPSCGTGTPATGTGGPAAHLLAAGGPRLTPVGGVRRS